MDQDEPKKVDSSKSIYFGSGLLIKEIDDKIIVCVDEKTRVRQGNFLLEGREIIIEGDRGIKISSRHPNILVISSDSTKVEEAMYDLRKEVHARLETIEKVFAKILKQVKS